MHGHTACRRSCRHPCRLAHPLRLLPSPAPAAASTTQGLGLGDLFTRAPGSGALRPVLTEVAVPVRAIVLPLSDRQASGCVPALWVPLAKLLLPHPLPLQLGGAVWLCGAADRPASRAPSHCTHLAARRVLEAAVRSHLGALLPPHGLWVQDSSKYHSTLWHASTHLVGW